MSSIELPTRENIDEAIVVSDTGSRNSALMVAIVTSSENELILPENENTSQAVWVDSDGKRHKVQMTANIYGGGSGGGADKNVITLTGESGTLTSEQIAQVLDDTAVLEIVCDGEVFRLSNKDSTLTYRTFMNTNCEASENVSFKVIYVQLNAEAVNYGTWTLEEVSAGGGAEIDDSSTALDKVWSASKLNTMIGDVETLINAL